MGSLEVGGNVYEKKKDEILRQFFTRVGVVPRPPCWVCKHKVPKLDVTLNAEKDAVEIIYTCHQKTAHVFVPTKAIDRIAAFELDWAFKDENSKVIDTTVRKLVRVKGPVLDV